MTLFHSLLRRILVCKEVQRLEHFILFFDDMCLAEDDHATEVGSELFGHNLILVYNAERTFFFGS